MHYKDEGKKLKPKGPIAEASLLTGGPLSMKGVSSHEMNFSAQEYLLGVQGDWRNRNLSFKDL